ncbi:9973_t:CDS:10, partial [Cetraspora pellucida]
MWENVLNDMTPRDSDHDFGSINRGNAREGSKPLSNESLLDNPNPPIDHEQQPILDQQATQLLQLSERNVVNYPMFSGRNQDPVEWIESITRAFCANNIREARRIVIASAHLSDLAALWWEELLYPRTNKPMEHRVTNKTAMQPVPRINQGTNVRSGTSFRPITGRRTIYAEYTSGSYRQGRNDGLWASIIPSASLCDHPSTYVTITPTNVPCEPTSRTCTTPECFNGAGNGAIGEPPVCYTCQQVGHYAHECPANNHVNINGNGNNPSVQHQNNVPTNDNRIAEETPRAQAMIAQMQEEAYIAKRKRVDKEPAEGEFPPGNSHSDGGNQASKQAANQKNEQGNGYETGGTSSNGKNPAILDNDGLAKQKGRHNICPTLSSSTKHTKRGVEGVMTRKVSAGFLKDVGMTIDRLSTVMMVGVHAVVTDAGNYAVIVGNDWMKKARACLDWESCELMIQDGDKKIKDDVSSSSNDDSVKSELDDEDEYDEEEGLCMWNKVVDRKARPHTEERRTDDFNLGNMTADQQHQVKEVLRRYEDIFACEPDQLGRMSIVQHKIHTEEGLPVKQRFYPTSKKEMWDFILAYMDDVNIYSSSFEKNLSHVDVVLEFLGHEISGKGITSTVMKVAAVSNFPRPKNLRALRGFLGLAGFYRRFIKDFSDIAAPLYKLLKIGENFVWKSKQQEAFDELKRRLTSAPILAHPQDSVENVLYTDASHLALGAVLSQSSDNGLESVVEYASRSTRPAEQNYTITELELTDHTALTYLNNMANPTGRMARYIMTLQGYDFVVKYRPGRQLGNVDRLSRIEES